jgi:hypothetical protein
MQIASATGEGATAALMIREFLEGHEREHSAAGMPENAVV